MHAKVNGAKFFKKSRIWGFIPEKLIRCENINATLSRLQLHFGISIHSVCVYVKEIAKLNNVDMLKTNKTIRLLKIKRMQI